MADNKIVLEVVADYNKAIKEWEQLRDNVAATTQEYEEAQKAIKELKQAKAELTGETQKSSKSLKSETEAQRESSAEYKKRKKDIESAFNQQESFNKAVGSSSVISYNNSINATKKERDALIQLRDTLDITGDEFQVLSNKISLLDQKLATSRKGISGLSKSNVQLKDSSGGATSAAMELGRVISDAPYGIRGMANNITQLVSQLGFQAAATNTATGAAYGFTGAIKQMWAALMGPLGIVLAVTTVVSSLDFFLGANKKAEESVSDLKAEFEGFAKVLRNDVNASIEEYIELMLEKRRVEKIIEKSSDKLKDVEEDLNDVLEKRKKLERDRAEQIRGYGKANARNTRLLSESRQKENELLDKRKEIIKDTATEINNLKLTEAEYEKQNEKNRKKKDEELEPLKGSVAWYEKIISARKEDRDDFATTAKEYEKYTKEIAKYQEELDKILNEKVDRDKVEVQFDLEMIDPSKLSKKAQQFLDTFKKYTKLEVKNNRDVMSDIIPEELSQETKDKLKEYKKKLYADMALTSDLEDFQDFADKFQKGLTAISDFAQAQFERDLVIEQNKTTALNEELNNRLLNENLSAEERKKIQNEIAKNDEALRLKQNEINKKKFNAQKAYNISMAVIDTAKAAAGVMAEAKGGFFARLAQAIPTIAFGLAQVATIASQKFQPQSATTPIRTSSGGAGGAGVGDRSFNFNLVGNTLGNQITDAIQGQFDQPLKAYVVSRDITSQQALDANIKGTASF